MNNKKYNIAVVGATGAVGRETIEILHERKFPYNKVLAIASDESLGKKVSFGDKNLTIDSLEHTKWEDVNLVFSSAGSSVTKLFIDKLPKDCILIDKTELYRLDPLVPLIIPEVNINTLSQYKNKNIIANPNCCVIPIAMTLSALGQDNKIKRVIISTYQSMSGAGRNAMHNLYEQTKNRFVYNDDSDEESQDKIAFNLTPQIGKLEKNFYTEEENKITAELKRILGQEIGISVTSVRVPVFISHCFSINVEMEKIFDIEELAVKLINFNGIHFTHDIISPVDASGKDEVFVARLRQDHSNPKALNLWITSDNLRKGAALNAVQIAEKVIDELQI